MITVDFSKRGATGLCDFLYRAIKAQMLSGALGADEKLPSKRSLADHLGVSVITVQNAYARLLAEGYLYSIEKKGFFAADIEQALRRPSVPPEAGLAPALYLPREPVPAGQLPTNLPPQGQQWKADFSSSATGFERFPFSLWAKIMRGVLVSGNERLLQKTDVRGVAELREAIAAHLYEFREMRVSPEQIVVGAGSESLYGILIQLLGRERIFALEDPGYKKIASVMAVNGAKSVHVPIDGAGMDIGALLETGAEVAHVSPAHHFPTGLVMPIKRRGELLAWAQERQGRFIIEDDYDSEFRFVGKPLPTLQSADKSGSVIYINTFTKTLAPSFRISYMVLPEELCRRFASSFGSLSCPVSAFEQFTLARFISQGHFARHIIRMKNYYRSVRNELKQALKAWLPQDSVRIHEEEAGLHFLLTLADSYPADRVQEALFKAGVFLPRLKDFFSGPAPAEAEQVFVVNYSGIQKNAIAGAAKSLAEALAGSV